MRSLPSIAVLLIILSCTPKEGAKDSGSLMYKSLLQQTEFNGRILYTGYKEVFENRDTNEGRKIKIFVTVMPALSDSVLSPVFHFEGGPGQPANVATWYYQSSPEVNEHRDIVLIDVRGTGNSNGLYCPAMQYDPTQPASAFEEMFPDEQVQACLNELRNSADLSQYSTPNIIEDVEEIRQWLGYGEINLIGFSYGTRVIETYARMYPNSIRSAVMGGPAPAAMSRPESFAVDAQRTWELICRDCANDPSCASMYPQLDADMKSLLAKLDQGPMPYTFHNEASGTNETVTLRRGPVTEAIRSTMYSTDGQRRLPSIIHQAALGNYGPIIDRVIRRSMSYRDLSSPLFLCITCSEDIPFIDMLDESEFTDGTFLSDYRIRRETNACKLWPRHAFSEEDTEPVITDIPVLIVTGSHDPVTPPSWATVMSTGMSNVSLVTVEYMAHSSYGMSNPNCLTRSYADFFNRPGSGFKMPCAAIMLPVPFR